MDTRQILTLEELELFVWNTQDTYREGLHKAKHYFNREDQWISFVTFCVARYSNDVLRTYRGCTLPLELWGVAASRFRKDFIEHLAECEEQAK